ncbi:MAG: VCBS repeat-containing protein [Candidatus Eremiobacterota bacterium]
MMQLDRTAGRPSVCPTAILLISLLLAGLLACSCSGTVAGGSGAGNADGNPAPSGGAPGPGGGGPAGDGAQVTLPTTATVVLNLLSRRGLSTFVTSLRFTALNASGAVVYGPDTRARSDRIALEGVPVEAVRLEVEFLSETDTVIGTASLTLLLKPGETFTLDDPEWLDAAPALFQLKGSAYLLGSSALEGTLRSGDFNGDGHPDIAAVTLFYVDESGSWDGLTVALGRGDGNLARQHTVRVPGLVSLAVGDVNGDGRADAVCFAAPGGRPQLQVFLGTVEGPLQPIPSQGTGGPVTGGILADLNGDGNLDLLARTPTGAVEWLGDGIGTFTSPTPVVGAPTGPVEGVADFDGDGNLDLVLGNSPQTSVCWGAGDGTFPTRTDLSPSAQPDVRAEILDLNGDGRPDLALASADPFVSTRLVASLPARQFADFGNVLGSARAAADFNGDGRIDLLCAVDAPPTDPPDHRMVVYRGRAGGLASAVTVLPGAVLGSCAAADFDGDGLWDVTGGLPPSRGMGGIGVFLYGHAQRDLLTDLLPVADTISSIVTADFNGDGTDDLAFGLTLPNSTVWQSVVQVWLKNPDGTLALASENRVGRNQVFIVPVHALDASDIDGDGHMDLAVGTDAVTLLFGRGDGTFEAPAVYATLVAGIDGIAVGHFTGDGNPDVGIADPTRVSVLLGRGGRNFGPTLEQPGGLDQPPDFPTISSVRSAWGDMNGDGRMDLVALGQTEIQVLLASESGFSGQTPFLSGALVTGDAALADFDGDGKLDLACALPRDALISLFTGDGAGSITSHRFLTAGPAVNALVPGDFNGDGRPDLAACFQGGIQVYLGTGEGNFPTSVVHASGENPDRLVAGDMNGDGRLDLVNLVDLNIALVQQILRLP